MRRLMLLAFAFLGAVQAQGFVPLVQTRQATLASRMEPKGVSCGLSVDTRTDIVAFPAGRVDRLYTYSMGTGRAYVLRQGRAQLVWCGKALYTPKDARRWASKMSGNAARALAHPFATKWGRLPVERGGIDIYSSFAGTVTTMRMNAAGRIVCLKDRADGFRGASQFGARDTCP